MRRTVALPSFNSPGRFPNAEFFEVLVRDARERGGLEIALEPYASLGVTSYSEGSEYYWGGNSTWTSVWINLGLRVVFGVYGL